MSANKDVVVMINGEHYEKSFVEGSMLTIKSYYYNRFNGFQVDIETMEISQIVYNSASKETAVLRQRVGTDICSVNVRLPGQLPRLFQIDAEQHKLVRPTIKSLLKLVTEA